MKELKFSARLNSFYTKPDLFWKSKKEISTLDLIDRIKQVRGLTHVELNYPQHFKNTTINEIKENLNKNNLMLGGIALRFDSIFNEGEFTNNERSFRENVIKTTKEAVQICNDLGGNLTTIWCAYDGFDYPFQIDYEEAWNMVIDGIRQVAEEYPDSKISIEYKPYQPRAYALLGDIGTTLLAINDINCDNVGITLDFCHMIMKKENPAYSLALAASKGRLMGVHLNDTYSDDDRGMMIGSVHFMQTLEFIYYLKKYQYEGLIYFDTFPLREDPIKECEVNIEMYKYMYKLIDVIGMSKIQNLLKNRNSLESQKILLDILRYKIV